MRRVRSLMAALCGWLAFAGAAAAQQYVPVGKDVDGNSYSVDRMSIRQENGAAYSWEKVELVHDRAVPGEMFRHWHTAIIRRVDNCLSKTTAFESWAYYDAEGKPAKTLTTASPHFRDLQPGTADVQILGTVCQMAEQMKATHRRLNFGPESAIQWVYLTTDRQTGGMLYWDSGGVAETSEGVRSLRYKVLTPVTAQTPANIYPTMFAFALVDCNRNAFFSYMTDSYNAVGALAASTASDLKQAQFHPVRTGSIGAEIVARVCTASARPVTGAAPSSPGGKKALQAGSGTGWLGPKGYIVTAAHVIKGAEKIALYQDSELVGTAEVVVADEANDIAVLKPQFKKAPPPASLATRHHSAQIGEHVFTLGFPAPTLLGAGLKMTSGEVSSTSGMQGDAREMQISVPVQPGNSGGPLMDDQGEVVGVVVARANNLGHDVQAQNVNYAVKEIYLEPLMEDLPDLGAHVQPVRSEKMTELVAAKRSSVFLIYVEGHFD